MPTHILVEWKLDDGAGYLLTGMMVRKRIASDENSKKGWISLIMSMNIRVKMKMILIIFL